MPSPLPRPYADAPVRRLTRGDLVPCADLCEDRGWPRDELRWGLLLSAGTGYGIDDPAGKGLMATCVVTSYGQDLAAVGMLLVAERYTRQGIARHLMRHVIEATGKTSLSLYATESGRPLYEELGFETVGRAERVIGHFRPSAASSDGVPTAGAVTVRPAAAGDLHAMLRLDTEVFGADRTHLLARLPAFADHLRVAEDDGELVGYAAIWPSERIHAVGPLIARDTDTAKALVTSLAKATDRPLRMDIDARHEELLSLLKECGLQAGSGTTVMTYRAPELPGDWTRRFAPLTVATG
ncbi:MULTISPECIES: GNAT family N-acetyltransferase [unclassified Streptomyces]|uniref:GNAT family N-acetyltransferase n=1 Tax=unclassified Streptomyces TaxID=2593676 RepID=UPI002DD7E5D1|nr:MULTISPECIES: GNAT family N-acetyltransferase [unclassified Streptomyces]WSF85712.1 GNAT family N-acetyltransferase [Streptomyces sp. NBC_01744]WSC38003.1 GNAT family N-acetyltransferase [Streptomyces sp. NBC_01763]WSC46126.1 GNAT family N-acetyltransferase [Streptomyces sp. NBC_01762]WSC54876.1 GNAT family N-acetyltransferase [Streptomyces sp. NBC_01761]WSD25780.1 GNAT family N-acetyltransferase [Streptomyces sp. NBC_01751]